MAVTPVNRHFSTFSSECHLNASCDVRRVVGRNAKLASFCVASHEITANRGTHCAKPYESRCVPLISGMQRGVSPLLRSVPQNRRFSQPGRHRTWRTSIIDSRLHKPSHSRGGTTISPFQSTALSCWLPIGPPPRQPRNGAKSHRRIGCQSATNMTVTAHPLCLSTNHPRPGQQPPTRYARSLLACLSARTAPTNSSVACFTETPIRGGCQRTDWGETETEQLDYLQDRPPDNSKGLRANNAETLC